MGERITSRCRDREYVPMVMGCLNLAACVNVVLYDRAVRRAILKPVDQRISEKWLREVSVARP